MANELPLVLYSYFDLLIPPIDEHYSTSKLFLTTTHLATSKSKVIYIETYPHILGSLSKFSAKLNYSDQLKTFLLTEGYEPAVVRQFLSDTVQLLFKCIFSHSYTLSQLNLLPSSFTNDNY